MAAVGVGTKYHLALNGQGFTLPGNGYHKRDAPTFAPRFSTGEQGFSDLDLYKVFGQNDFSGGMYQKNFEDPKKLLSISNLRIDPLEKAIYPVSAPQTVDATSATLATTGMFIKFRSITYLAVSTRLYKITAGSPGSLSAVKTDFANAISSMAVIGDRLIVATSGNTVWKYDGTTWTSYATYGFTMLFPFNDYIVATGSYSGGDSGSTWIRRADDTVSAIGAVGDKNIPIKNGKQFQGRLYVGKGDGLFAYDGIKWVCVLDFSSNFDANNFAAMDVYNGALYFNVKNQLWRFNGSSVEKVFVASHSISTITAAYGYLWFGTIDRGAGGGQSVKLYSYDGSGVSLMYDSYDSTYAGIAAIGYGGGEYADITIDVLYFLQSKTGTPTVKQIYPIESSTAAYANVGKFETSEFDAGYPNVTKYLNDVAVDYSGAGVGDSILVEFSVFDGTTWSSYNTLGTLTSTSTTNKLSIYDTLYTASSSFKKIKLRFTVTYAQYSTLVIRGYSAGYYIVPSYKRRWQLKLLAQGQSDEPLELLDSSSETATARQLRDAVYSARESVSPVAFEDIDYSTLTGSHNNSTTTITVSTTYGWPSKGRVKIDDEIISYTGKTATTLTGCTRGVLGTSAASHSDQAIVTPYYRVVVTDIVDESVIIPTADSYGTPSMITAQLQEA